MYAPHVRFLFVSQVLSIEDLNTKLPESAVWLVYALFCRIELRVLLGKLEYEMDRACMSLLYVQSSKNPYPCRGSGIAWPGELRINIHFGNIATQINHRKIREQKDRVIKTTNEKSTPARPGYEQSSPGLFAFSRRWKASFAGPFG